MTNKQFTMRDALEHMTNEVQRLTFDVDKARQEGREEILMELLKCVVEYDDNNHTIIVPWDFFKELKGREKEAIKCQ